MLHITCQAVMQVKTRYHYPSGCVTKLGTMTTVKVEQRELSFWKAKQYSHFGGQLGGFLQK